MHDLQTIIKLNNPVNLKTPALDARLKMQAIDNAISELDRVEYGNEWECQVRQLGVTPKVAA